MTGPGVVRPGAPAAPTYDSRMVTVGHVRLHCTVAGAGDAVVLLHG